MLEGLVAWFINTYVGEFVENLNTDQLSIGLLQGKVELENLPLKKDALKYLGLPIEVTAGFIGKIHLHIPIYRLRSEPWVIDIEKLYLIAGKVSHTEYNEEKEEQAAQHRKLSRLDVLEAKWKAEFEIQDQSSSYYAHSYLSWLSYGTALMSNIIENLQLNIKDIHIRYEDECSPGSSFACGVLINCLSAQSTDEYWVPKYITKNKANVMCKLMEINGLAIYWDTTADILGQMSIPDMTLNMEKLKEDANLERKLMKHEYILEPVGVKAQLKHNCSAELHSRQNPYLICDLQLESFPLRLNEFQYKQMVQTVKEIDRLDSSWMYRKWRPDVPVKKDPRKWWQFAIHAHLEPISRYHQRQTWDFVLQRTHNIVLYHQIYYTYLTVPDGLTVSMKAQKDELEQELEFHELCILRGLVMEKIQKEYSLKKAQVAQFQSQGILQRWFPGWTGWYSSNEGDGKNEEGSDKETSKEEINNLKTKFEEELFDVFESEDYNAILKHDKVCAQLNFSLTKSTVILSSYQNDEIPQSPTTSISHSCSKKMKPLIEFELSDVETTIETRPRSGSLLLSIKLGAMYLYDKITPDTIFPCLVAPQNKEVSYSHSKFSNTESGSLFRQISGYSARLKKSLLSTEKLNMKTSPLFHLIYDRKPLSSSADHRLIINSHPLNVVYNPTALRSIIDFFSLFQENESFNDSFTSDFHVGLIGTTKYEALKSQTKAEIKQRLDQILEGEQRMLGKISWEINLAISAPEIIVPENFQDTNGIVVVFDLGKLHFYNVTTAEEKKSEIGDEDTEDFITPCSTPPKDPVLDSEEMINESDIQWDELPFVDLRNVNEESVRERIYEKYILKLTDMQVLVSQAKDNWRFAQRRGTSSLHVLDRFSVSLQMERQLISTKNPQWPNITICGKLPKLVVHLNDYRIDCLKSCFDIISSPLIRDSNVVKTSSPCFTSSNATLSEEISKSDIENENCIKSQELLEDTDQETVQESLLLLMWFCIDEVSFEVRSRGRAIAELQVTGVKTTFSKRPYDTSVTLCVHGLLLVDALQTFGPDFELLIASHRNVCMDSMSGSLHDSEQSSVSSMSPQILSSPIPNRSGETSPSDWHLNPAQRFHSKVPYLHESSSSSFVQYPSHSLLTGDIPATDTLIMVEFVTVTTPPFKKNGEYVGEKLNIVSVQFNSLDITGNQETIVELIDFMKRLFTKCYNETKTTPVKESSMKSVDKTFSEVTQSEEASPVKIITRTELTFDFHRLNILLLHALSNKQSVVGQKVATATMSGARFQASIGTSIQIHGALSGFQVLDLITEGNTHQRVLSVGQDPLVSHPTDIHSGLYKPAVSFTSDNSENTEKAFSFTINRNFQNKSNSMLEKDADMETGNEILEIKIRMASLFYIHSPHLLYELSSCATEFKEYMSIIASSIKSAAAEVAIGIMSKRIEGISTFSRSGEGSPFRKQFNHNEKASYLPNIFSDEEVNLDLKLDILLHTPVLVFPSSPYSSHVLVAHLGQITVQNDSLDTSSSDFNDLQNASTVSIEIRDMNLFSLNIENNTKLLIKEKPDSNISPNYSVEEIYNCSKNGQPILHNTVIEINTKNIVQSVITNTQKQEQFWLDDEVSDNFVSEERRSLLEIRSCVVAPLKIILTKSQYDQILDTLNNLAYCSPIDEDLAEILLEVVEGNTRSSNNATVPLEKVDSSESFHCKEKSHITPNKSIHALFMMPDLTVELVSDCVDMQRSLVLVTFQEFLLKYEKEDSFMQNMQVTLHSLMVEDLLQLPTSKHRYLMRSIVNLSQRKPQSKLLSTPPFVSTSCPNITNYSTNLYLNQCSSLPDHLSTQNVFSMQLNSFHKMRKKGNLKYFPINENTSYPNTPPPSPSGQFEGNLVDDALVHINITLVDKNSPLFESNYDKINQFVDVTFNCLETTANMQTWIMVLDFFRSDSTTLRKSTFSEKNISSKKNIFNEQNQLDENDKKSAFINSKLDISVRSLTLVLCKQEYEVAKANISTFICHTVFRNDNFSAKGKLGSLSLLDLTTYGKFYPERFITSGESALHFDIFKFGEEDNELTQEFDMSIKCRMSSVQYVHTHRFFMDLLNFMQHLSEVQDVMRQIQSTTSITMNLNNSRKSRIKLDIAAGSPVIVIPQSSSSSKVLVADLGNLVAHNVFLFAGSSGTISAVQGNNKDNYQVSNKVSCFEKNGSNSFHNCLLDVIFLELSDIDLYSATCCKETESKRKKNADLLFPSFIIRKEGPQLLQEKFMLKIQVERNLHSDISHSVADMTINGTFSSVYFTVDIEQYKLVRGILKYNLGEQFEDIAATKSTGPYIMPKRLFEQVWTTLAIHLELVNVTVDIVSNQCNSECVNATMPLAKFDFIKSRLLLECYSDCTKDIDLISHEIRISDTRYKDAPVNNRPNVFTNILYPTKESGSTSLPQAELHYIMKHNCTSFIISLNCMRVMSIFDWSKDVLKFLCSEIDSLNPVDIFQNNVSLESSCSECQDTTCNIIDEVPITLKLYLMDTEVVVVENPSLWDTNAVILKTTASFKWIPSFLDCPMTCEFRSMEVFSCILGVEEETALSIIDPVSFTVEITKTDDGILQLTDEISHLLKLKLENLNLRLSYHDITMFVRILESFSRQTGLQFGEKQKIKEKGITRFSEYVSILEGMGYDKQHCIQALTTCNGELNDSAVWLTANAPHNGKLTKVLGPKNEGFTSTINLQAMAVTVSRGCLCIIDDCRDSDVPCFELTVNNLEVDQSFTGVHRGKSVFVLSADYYNRALSGWEPFIEPWRCKVSWNFFIRTQTNQLQKISFQTEAEETLNMNITSSLLDLYQNVKKTWMEDYYRVANVENMYRRRSPFVPFAIKNDLGCKLWFRTVITSSDKENTGENKFQISEMSKTDEMNWLEVHAGQVVPFTFEGRDKLRHKDSHRLRKHQLIIRINDWHQLAPVSIDQVGVFFRFAKPQLSRLTHTYAEVLPTRIVFAVTLEGNARKLVTVRSGLLLTNKCDDTMELKMENVNLHYSVPGQTLYLVSHTTMAIPLSYIYAQMWLRPVDKPVVYSSNPVVWQHIVKPGDIGGELNICKSVATHEQHYRISICIKKEHYLTDSPWGSIGGVSSQKSVSMPMQLSHQPGHKIFLIPPLQIINLLPYELHYNVKDKETRIYGHIKPGHHVSLHKVDISDTMTFELSCENFPKCNELIVRPCTREFLARILLYDNQDRLLMLQARIVPLYGGALKISISAPYWLINNSGLPLVFRQEGTQIEAAGQSDEHELARSLVPLLFSFSDRDASAMCSVRVGHLLHPNSSTQWCSSFNLEKGIRVRHLHVTPRDYRPDWVYTIGIDVRMGRGRYRDTYMVTFSPRYQLDNRSSYKLDFAQKFATENLKSGTQYIMSAMPKCKMAFHWPRVDLDNLLCVRFSDIPECMWSGGFSIDKINSFHVNMRNGHGKSHFLRIEILLQGAKYCIVFTDAEKMPPPLRIDNHSEVSILYYQTNVKDERLKTSIKPGSCVPYAWDEPTLPPMITCVSPGGATATYNMNVFGEGDKLFYENFIYLAFTGTIVSPEQRQRFDIKFSKSSSFQDLVLDICEGTTKVILNRKEPGKRSQLWRMGSTGKLYHEGSSPPQDPRKKISPKDLERTLVLDIAGLSPLPGMYVPLMLRKPDERRSLTQTWHFTQDGRLCCDHPNLFVQSKDGFSGLRAGSEAVLGPNQPVIYMSMPNDIPIEQAIAPHKLRGGSGVLAVKIIPDGPTRVLQISDFRQKRIVSKTSHSTDWIVVEEQTKPEYQKTKSNQKSIENYQRREHKEKFSIHICAHLSGGFGISLINHLSEELIYVSLHNIMVDYNRSEEEHTIDGSIQNIQIDNQLREAERPNLLYVTPPNKKDQQRHLPAFHMTANKIFTEHQNAEIFKHLIITVKILTLQAEEKLVLKLLQFAGYNQSDAELEKTDENDTIPQKALQASSATACRYYFNTLKLSLPQVKLSVLTSGSLPPELLHIKKKMGWKLIRFEDAVVELDPFVRVHPFETLQFLIDSIVEHYKEELKSQAAKILGAVDFLGNPLGLVYHVSDGINDLINEGDMGGLIKNVAHGLSDSAAKMTGSLSDSLGLVAMDDHHEEIRKRIKCDNVNAGNDPLIAGLKGLGYGLLGGVTSLITQPYAGATSKGVQGFFSGIGKGIVGTVAKPAVGFLDLATGAAIAVRDTSRRNSQSHPERCRLPRVCFGPGGLLPQYNAEQAKGQQVFFSISNNNPERFISRHWLRRTEGMELLISSERIFVVNRNLPSANAIILLVPFKKLLRCNYVYSNIEEARHYVQLTVISESSSLGIPDQPSKRPQFRCDNQALAQRVVEEINYVNEMYEERFYTLVEDGVDEMEDDH